MKPVRIAVLMKEPAFGRAVARGLAESGNGFLIEVMERDLLASGAALLEEWMDRSETWEVLVTDCGSEDCLESGSGDGLEEGEKNQSPGLVLVDPETFRISQLCRQVQETADRVRERKGIGSGESLRQRHGTSEDGMQTEIIGFLGLYGGCGVTALAVTVGRMLAGAYGEKVLYLPLTETDGAWLYREAELLQTEGSSGECPQRGKELLYRLSHELPCSVEGFVLRDCYGLEMLEGIGCLSSEELQDLLTHLAEKGGYDWILADLGSRECLRPVGKQTAVICSALVEVGNRMDSRCRLGLSITLENRAYPNGWTDPDGLNASDSLPERRIMVWNHGIENRMAAGEQEWLEIAHDGESFLPNRETGRIEIAMTKNFAIGVKNLTEILLNFYRNDLRNMSNEIEW